MSSLNPIARSDRRESIAPIFIRTPSELVRVEAVLTHSVSALKAHLIGKGFFSHPEEKNLRLENGKQKTVLSDDSRSLQSYRVCRGSTISIVARGRDGLRPFARADRPVHQLPHHTKSPALLPDRSALSANQKEESRCEPESVFPQPSPATSIINLRESPIRHLDPEDLFIPVTEVQTATTSKVDVLAGRLLTKADVGEYIVRPQPILSDLGADYSWVPRNVSSFTELQLLGIMDDGTLSVRWSLTGSKELFNQNDGGWVTAKECKAYMESTGKSFTDFHPRWHFSPEPGCRIS